MSEFVYEDFESFSTGSEALPSISDQGGRRVLINPTVSEDNDYAYESIDDASSQTSIESDEGDEDEDAYIDKTIFGEWGFHCLLRRPWADIDKPTVRVLDYYKLRLNDEEDKGVLTDRIVASCSSYLDRSPYVKKYVMAKCVLSHKVLEKYGTPFVVYLDNFQVRFY